MDTSITLQEKMNTNIFIYPKFRKKGMLVIDMPYAACDDFSEAWQAIKGTQSLYDGKRMFPVKARPEVWNLLQRFFPGYVAQTPKGYVRIPGNKINKYEIVDIAF